MSKLFAIITFHIKSFGKNGRNLRHYGLLQSKPANNPATLISHSDKTRNLLTFKLRVEKFLLLFPHNLVYIICVYIYIYIYIYIYETFKNLPYLWGVIRLMSDYSVKIQVKIQFRTLLKKKIVFPWCSTREDLSIDVSITNVELILTKLGWLLFSGYGQTDTVLESSHGNMSAHKKFQLKAQN